MNIKKKEITVTRSGEHFTQYKPLQKFIDRLVFRKLKLAIRSFCSNMNPDLLQAISPRLYRLVFKTEKSVEIKFKLLGTRWPPQIIYKANVSLVKSIGFNCREIEPKQIWRHLFSDKVVQI